MVRCPLADSYRPMLQWVWDTDPTPPMLQHQLQRIAEAGFAGVVIQPMPDNFRPHDFPVRMSLPYLGPAFFQVFRDAVELAKNLGLVVWLYDEGGWPSGSACGQVLRGHEELRAQNLIHESGRCIVVPGDRPDPFSLQATQRFMSLTHEGYARAVGDHFGTTIRAVFTDELTVPGCVGTDRIPWSAALPDEFARRFGYDLHAVLPLLFEGAAASLAGQERVLQVRHDFSRLCVELFVERCLKPQREWCEAHGLNFLGHFAGEHDLMRHPHNVGDYMAAARQLHTPGVDAIWRQIWPDHRADFARFAGSIRLLRGGDAFSETGAVYGTDLSPGQWKWVCDQQILRGINRFSLMSLRLSGAISEGLSPLDLQDPTWTALPAINRHIGLLTQLCSSGRARIRDAVLYPSEDIFACGSDGRGMAAQGVMEHLQAAGVEAVYVDEVALGDDGATVRDLGVQRLYLPGGAVVSAATVQRIQRLEQTGVRVHVVGIEPMHVLGQGAMTSWKPAPMPAVKPDAPLRLRGGGPVSLTSRDGDNGDVTIVFNESDVEQAIELLDEAIEVYDVDEQLRRRRVIGQTMTLAPGAVAMLQRGSGLGPSLSEHVDEDVSELAASNAKRESVTVELQHWRLQPVYHLEISADDRWIRVPENRSAVDGVALGPWSAIVGEDFSGQVRYEATFTLAFPVEALSIDLGVVEHVAQVQVDGQAVGSRAFAPYRVTWTGRLTAGPHRLEVWVSNTSAGAYWRARRTTPRRENVYVQRIRERCPVHLGRGLMGPVRIDVRKPTGV